MNGSLPSPPSNGPSSELPPLRVYKFLLSNGRGGGLAVVVARTPAEARQVAVAHAQKLGRESVSFVAEKWIAEARMAEEPLDRPRVLAWAEC